MLVLFGKRGTLKGWEVGQTFRCDQASHPVKFMGTGSNSGSAPPAGQAPHRLRFPRRLLRAHGNEECSPHFVQTLGAQQVSKRLAVSWGPRTRRIRSAFQVSQDGAFTDSAQSFPSANSKAPIKSWDPQLAKVLEFLMGIRVYNSGRVTGKRRDWEKDVTSGWSRHFQVVLLMQISIYG